MEHYEIYGRDLSEDAYLKSANIFYRMVSQLSNITKLKVRYPKINESVLLSIAHVIRVVNTRR